MWYFNQFYRYSTAEHPRLYVEAGDLFSLKNGFDGIAAFVPCGLTAFRVAFKSFVQSNPSGIVMVADENSQNRIYDEIDVKHMVFEALNVLVRYGVKNIGMCQVPDKS